MNRLEVFTDSEIYVIKRAFTESSWEFTCSGNYGETAANLHNDLFNEFVNEDTKRLHK